jgi:branched-chain amino acid transport system substrate-binding protein
MFIQQNGISRRRAKMKRKGLVALVGGMCLLLLLAAVPGCAQSAPKETIRIGALMDETSWERTSDEPTERGIRFCLDQMGWEIDGHPVDLEVRDYACDSNMGLDAVKTLIERDKVQMVIGPVEMGVASAIGPYVNSVGIPWIDQDTYNLQMAQSYQWLWECLGAWEQAAYDGGVAAAELGYKTITTMGIDYVAGHTGIDSFVEGFTENGGTVVQQQWFPAGVTDLAPYLAALKDADLLVWCGWGPVIVSLHTQAEEFGIKQRMDIFQLWQQIDLPEMRQALGTTPIGTIGNIFWIPNDETANDQSKKLEADFLAEFGYPIDHDTVMGYRCMQIIAEAFRLAKGDYSPANLAKALDAVDIETAMGQAKFGPYNLMEATVLTVKVVSDGAGGYKQVVLKRHVTGVKEVNNELKPYIIKELD